MPLLRESKMSKFLNEMQEVVNRFGPTGADPAHVVPRKWMELREAASDCIDQNYKYARLGNPRRQDKAVREGQARSAPLGDVLQEILQPPRPAPKDPVKPLPLPPAAPVTPRASAAPPAWPGQGDSYTPSGPAEPQWASPVYETLEASVAENHAVVQEKPHDTGFSAEINLNAFTGAFRTGEAYCPFMAMGRAWNVQLLRYPSDKLKAGFWLSLREGEPLFATFTYHLLGQRGALDEGRHTATPRFWEPGAPGWGFSWQEGFGISPEALLTDSSFLDSRGTLLCRIDVTRA